MIDEKILCAGFGGQGVMSLGQLLAYGGMLAGLHVTWLPSYGPEMRGGTAYCSVMLAEHPVGSPVIAGDATCAIIMNLPSLIKFEPTVSPGGLLLVNSSMVEQSPERTDITTYSIPAGDLARECGESKAANMVMLGAYLGLKPVMQTSVIEQAFPKVFGEKAARLVEHSMKAVASGMEYVQSERLTQAA